MSGRISTSADKHNQVRGQIYLALKLSRLRGGSEWKVKLWSGCPVQQPSVAPLFKFSWAIWFVNPLGPCGPKHNTLPLCCQFRTLAGNIRAGTLSLHSAHSLCISNFESHLGGWKGVPQGSVLSPLLLAALYIKRFHCPTEYSFCALFLLTADSCAPSAQPHTRPFSRSASPEICY